MVNDEDFEKALIQIDKLNEELAKKNELIIDLMDKTRVFNLDCLPALQELPDNTFDLAIIDCPYGIGEDGRNNHTRGKLTKSKDYRSSSRYDNCAPDKSYFTELFRVSKNQIIWGANHLGNLPPPSCWIVWDKVNGASDFADCELAWTSFTSAVRIFRFMWSGAMQGNPSNGNIQQGNKSLNEVRIHPNQKPVALYKWLLKNYAKEGDKILDSHGGSMSSVIACLDMGFSITCYELDPDYYNAGKNRIINHLKQLNAFRPAYDIEFHDNSGVSQLRNNAGIGYQEQKDWANNNPIHRVDGLFHGDPSQSDIQTPKAS